jgi:hypothetical protein
MNMLIRCATWSLMLFGCLAGTQAEAQAAPAGYSSTALYNLGNAYARAGKPGMAVVNYERADLLAPGDPDIERNLSLVRLASGFPVEPKSRLDRALGAVSPAAASWMGVIGLALLGLAVLAGRLTAAHPSSNRWARRLARGAAVIVGIALLGVTVGNGMTLWPGLHEAIVIAGAAPVRISPAPMGEVLFTLREAEAVRLSGEHEGFFLVRTPAGRTGWVWHADLEPIVPRNQPLFK